MPTANSAIAADPFAIPFVEQIEDAGRTLGIAIQTIRVGGEKEFDAAFAAMDKERADAVMVQGSLQRKRALELALKHRLPLIGGQCPADSAKYQDHCGVVT